ncbi:ABC transporter permease [Streptomyces sp. 6N223]|uniref:ABC transporter permease n=1 Tax=Streptomyces sp. 6N223 TaxID=3457412 RepID=UPI003FD3F52A
MSAARIRSVVAPGAFLVVFFTLWQVSFFNAVFALPEYAVPLPDQIAEAMMETRGDLGVAFVETFRAVGAGWALGNLLGFALALALLFLPPRVAGPVGGFFAAFQSLPIIALAPLVALWIDSHTWFKATTVVIMVFPQMLVYAFRGLTGIQPAAMDLARSCDASWSQVFRFFRLPLALPHVFTSLRYSVVLALIGTVVCEILRSADGLGYHIHDALQRFDAPGAWGAVAILGLSGVTGYASLLLFERLVAPWAFKRG